MAILLMGKLSFEYAFFVIFFAAQQFICIFGIHILVANLNKKIHRPSKQIIHLNLHDQFLRSKNNILIKLKLNSFIIVFHTRKKYGVTYGKNLGLITLKTFS